MQALGACIWYLKCCLLDQQILALKKFAAYIPKDGESCAVKDQKVYFPSYMVCKFSNYAFNLLLGNYSVLIKQILLASLANIYI